MSHLRLIPSGEEGPPPVDAVPGEVYSRLLDRTNRLEDQLLRARALAWCLNKALAYLQDPSALEAVDVLGEELTQCLAAPQEPVAP